MQTNKFASLQALTLSAVTRLVALVAVAFWPAVATAQLDKPAPPAHPEKPATLQPQQTQAEQSDTAFLNDFITVALGREYGGANQGQLIKWAKPIRVGVTGEEGVYYRPAVEQHITDLQDIISHPISLVRGGEADILVIFLKKLTADDVDRFQKLYRPFFASDEAYQKQLNAIRDDSFKAVCLTTIRTIRSKGELTGAIAFIPAEKKSAVAWQCIVEEITQALGLPNDSDTNFYSIFNDRSPHISLTTKDKRMLRLLYDPRIKAGMREPEVRQTATEILKEWAAAKTAGANR
jgi:hypothetical protein